MFQHSQHVLTLANSIIGVSILAMPYCFKQCGVLLAIIILLVSNLISRLSCHFLLKSAIIARRKTFEYLAYYIFGALGKFAIEIGIIGFLIGTCIAFFVVMGDLGPEIIAEISGRNTSNTMRTSILMALALFCVLPLGLLRNIDSLSGVSRATIGFYVCLISKIVIEALPHFLSGDWVNRVEIWRPAGVIQCLPIFSMALSCQTQLFEIYQVVNNPTLEKMNYIVKSAVNVCTLVYLFVGFFGYIAFSKNNFTGNVLLSFEPSILTNLLKFGFILSIAFSFPLVIFPCRASIHSLVYGERISLHEGVSNYIPEGRFKGITLMIVFISLIIGILIPNIELVLGLVGSTIGIMICVLFPVICFIHISQKNTNERLLAKLVLVIGLILMVLGTYENLTSLEKIEASPVIKNIDTEYRELKIVDPAAKDLVKNVKIQSKEPEPPNPKKLRKDSNLSETDVIVKVTDSPEVRHEPPQPIEPQDSPVEAKIKVMPEATSKKREKSEVLKSEQQTDKKESKNIIKDEIVPEKISDKNPVSKLDIQISIFNDTKKDQVDVEAIKKDDKESQIQQKSDKNSDSHLEDHKILLDTIQKQNEVQEEIVKQQKKLIEVIEKQQDQKAQEEKLKAVKEIETIALKALEKISGDTKNNERIVAELEKDVKERVISNKNDQNKNINNIEKNALFENIADNELKDFKVANRLLNNKIKNNNITTKKSNMENIEQIRQNLPQSKIIDENMDFNANSNKSQEKVPVPSKTNTLNDTAPLFLNLGPKSAGENRGENIQEPIKNIPLPTAASLQQMNNSASSIKIDKKNNEPLPPNNSEQLLNEEVNVMRREILEYMIAKKKR